MRSATHAVCAILALTGCGPGPGTGPGPVEPTAPAGTGTVLDQGSYMGLFEEDQAAYYIEHQDTIWLVVRLAEGNDEATLTKLALHLLSRVAEAFDFSGDTRTQMVILVYMGVIEARTNYGIKIDIADLKRLQAGEMDMPTLMEGLTEVVNINLIALKPYITG